MKEVQRVGRDSRSGTRPWISCLAVIAMGLFGLGLVPGCATKGDFRKLEERVLDQSRKAKTQPDPFERIAALSAEIESLRQEQQRLAGELEITQKKADDALVEAQKAREAEAAQAADEKNNSAAGASNDGDAADDAARGAAAAAIQNSIKLDIRNSYKVAAPWWG